MRSKYWVNSTTNRIITLEVGKSIYNKAIGPDFWQISEVYWSSVFGGFSIIDVWNSLGQGQFEGVDHENAGKVWNSLFKSTF